MQIGFINFTPLVYDVDTPYKNPLGGLESGMCYLADIQTLKRFLSNDESLEQELRKQITFCNQEYTWRKRAEEWGRLLQEYAKI